MAALIDKQQQKWDQHYQANPGYQASAAAVLAANQHLLPEHGTALDLACGRGANALLLATHGLAVSAWDISKVALQQLAAQAQAAQLTIAIQCRDVIKAPPAAAAFDVIVISQFLERDLMPAIKTAIKPNGLVFYQTFTQAKVNSTGPTNPAYRLASNELLHFFCDWQLIYYQEEGCIGNIKKGFRDQAMLIARQISTDEST